MKFLAFLAVIAGGIYFYMNGVNAKDEVQITNYQDLLNKVDVEPVSMGEIKLGSNMQATFFCNDESFQKSGGGSVQKCMDTYQGFKEMCEERIFTDMEQNITSKDQVTKIAKRYIACVGIR